MFVVSRTREGTAECPGETVQLAGTTGNVYTVKIGNLPSCNCPHARKGNQCKHIAYVMGRVLHAPENLEYQLALLNGELKEIFDKAPPIPAASSDGDGKRKPIEDDCPICCMPFEDGEDIVYCKAACGNNIHKDCFQQWAATKTGHSVPCPFCRTPWQQADASDLQHLAGQGKLNDDGYINIGTQLGLSGTRGKLILSPMKLTILINLRLFNVSSNMGSTAGL
jgi:hypothetical protein